MKTFALPRWSISSFSHFLINSRRLLAEMGGLASRIASVPKAKVKKGLVSLHKSTCLIVALWFLGRSGCLGTSPGRDDRMTPTPSSRQSSRLGHIHYTGIASSQERGRLILQIPADGSSWLDHVGMICTSLWNLFSTSAVTWKLLPAFCPPLPLSRVCIYGGFPSALTWPERGVVWKDLVERPCVSHAMMTFPFETRRNERSS
ncbi:hypothetical protein F4859DRAFT_184177 [Xylaria cf. heliscus]|nr:hypothetical protein F4859DRAFT_184177 [Xylaria cf. heliscus]